MEIKRGRAQGLSQKATPGARVSTHRLISAWKCLAGTGPPCPYLIHALLHLPALPAWSATHLCSEGVTTAQLEPRTQQPRTECRVDTTAGLWKAHSQVLHVPSEQDTRGHETQWTAHRTRKPQPNGAKPQLPPCKISGSPRLH